MDKVKLAYMLLNEDHRLTEAIGKMILHLNQDGISLHNRTEYYRMVEK